MKKNVIVFGLISGGLIATFGVCSVYLSDVINNYNGSMYIGFGAQILALSLMYVAIKNYRDKENGGIVSFGKAFQIGLYISLIASTMYVIAWAIDYHYFLPDFMEKYTAHMVSQAQSSRLSKAKIAAQIAQAAAEKKMYENPFWFTLITYREIFPTGLIVSLITALILKKKVKSAEAVIA